MLLRDNKPLNDDMRKKVMNPFEKIWEKCKDNKRKLTFFIAICIIC